MMHFGSPVVVGMYLDGQKFIYRQILDQYRELITAGIVDAGSRLSDILPTFR